MGVPQHKL